MVAPLPQNPTAGNAERLSRSIGSSDSHFSHIGHMVML
jgi:hypothetical protein